jgi:1,2-phenylacetyl-CoA epoxidase catalytic subunit
MMTTVATPSSSRAGVASLRPLAVVRRKPIVLGMSGARTPKTRDALDKVPRVNVEELAQAERLIADTDERHEGVFRYFELAKRAEWQTRDLPWGELPPIPEAKGPPEKLARRRDVWRSVITQQLQADALAVEMAAQLLNLAPHLEAKLYYSTMVQDESRHVEAWLRLVEEVGGTAERDPHLDELARVQLDADTLEEKVFLMQVFYERLIIPRFRLIARSSRGTILEDICNRLTIDDGIHHGAGMAYERVLLENASKQTKQQLIRAANRLLPIFVEHALWRPRERAWIGSAMRDRDIQRLKEDLEDGVRMAQSLGLDVSDVVLPVP